MIDSQRTTKMNKVVNTIPHAKGDSFILYKNGEFIYLVMGTDSSRTNLILEKIANNEVEKGNLKGLVIKPNMIALINYDCDINSKISKQLSDRSHGFRFSMPSNFDFDKNCAYKMEGDSCVKYTEPHVGTYYKYCLSRIGNPKYNVLIKIKLADYKKSNLYLNRHK